MATTTRLREGFFVLDLHEDDMLAFPGYTEDDDWNGFAVPYFDFRTSMRLAAWLAQHGFLVRYVQQQDEFQVFDSNLTLEDFERGTDIVDTFRGSDKEGQHLYSIGGMSWTWSEVDREDVERGRYPAVRDLFRTERLDELFRS